MWRRTCETLGMPWGMPCIYIYICTKRREIIPYALGYALALAWKKTPGIIDNIL